MRTVRLDSGRTKNDKGRVIALEGDRWEIIRDQWGKRKFGVKFEFEFRVKSLFVHSDLLADDECLLASSLISDPGSTPS